MTENGIRVTCTGAGQPHAVIVARLDELERKFEENPRRYFAPLANEYRKTGDAGRAVALCRAQLPGIPGHISGHIVLGQALYDVGDYAGSRSALETALTLDPENIVALRYLGDIARDTGDTVQAARWYTRTLEADPYNDAAQAGLELLRTSEAEPLPERQGIDSRSPEPPAAIWESPEPQAADFDLPEPRVAALGTPQPRAAELESLEPQAAAVESSEPQVSEVEAPEFPNADLESPTVDVDRAPVVEVAAGVDTADEPASVAEPSADNPEASADIPEAPADTPEAFADIPAAFADIPEASTDIPEASAEFAGDLDVSAVTESAEPPGQETVLPKIAPDVVESAPTEAADDVTDVVEELLVDVEAHRAPEPVSTGDPRQPEEDVREETVREETVLEETVLEETVLEATVPEEAVPEEAVQLADALQTEEAIETEEGIQAEERGLEAAAPFVTETMADLYLEQGYPHEALELMLQLAEQRPDDESLRVKIERIESTIAARRDAAVAAARAERAEVAETHAAADAPSDAPVAEIDSTSSVAMPDPFQWGSPEAEGEAPQEDAGDPAASAAVVDDADQPSRDVTSAGAMSVREMFARMDGSRPSVSPLAPPPRAPVLRSDFVPMPAARSSAAASPKSDTREHRAGVAPRSSGPHPTFDPSTAGKDDFDAWLRGLRGP